MRRLICSVWLGLLCSLAAAQTHLEMERDSKGRVVSVAFAANSTSEPLNVGPNTWDTIQSLKDLQALSLWGTTVTNDDLRQLLSNASLVSIDLSYTKVTGEVLSTLKQLPKLRLINLEGCAVKDAHLRHLEGLERLITLRLAKTKVTDKGVAEIARLKSLNHLDLSSCDVTDAGLRSLGLLPDLQHLWLSKTVRHGVDDKSRFTDGCIEYLCSLPKLIDLRIADSSLSPAGIERLRKSMPSAKIDTVSSGVLYIK